MPTRFRLPKVSRRHFSLILSILVLAVAAAYLLDRAQSRQPIAADAVQAFRNSCMKAARHANGGGDLVMDEATEAKIGAYCGCVSDAVASNVPPAEIARIAQGQTNDTTLKLLDGIIDGCKPKLE
jgi:hypothetical protein